MVRLARLRRFTVALAVFGGAAALVTAASVGAETITVDGGGCTLAKAIDSANTDTPQPFSSCAEGDGADVIVLGVPVEISAAEATAAGSSNLHGGIAGLPDITSDITIQAGGGSTIARGLGPNSCGPSPPSPFRLFNVVGGGALTLEGVTLQHGCIAPTASTEGRGGAITVNFGTLTVIGGSFLGNRVRGGNGAALAGSPATGGAIAVFGATASLTLVDTLFEGNTARAGDSTANGGAATAEGGAVLIEFADSLTITGSELRANQAIAGDCSDTSCTGSNGLANGGALYIADTPFTITDTIFSGNSARGGDANQGVAQGGAIAVFTATGTLERLIVTDNQALGGPGTNLSGGHGLGGALYVSTAPTTIRGSLFSANGAIGGAGATGSGLAHGGAIYWSGSGGEITGSTFLDNLAQGASGTTATMASGGALRVVGASEPLLANSTFVGNTATGGTNAGGIGAEAFGGAIATVSALPALSHLTVSSNEAIGGGGVTGGTAEGGGIYIDFETTHLDNSILAGNHVTPGGGVAVADDCASSGTFVSDGYNFVQAPHVSCAFAATGDQTGDPALLPASDYGCAVPLADGSCPPLAPIPAGSPAVDAGSCVVSGLTTDQRGAPRPVDDTCDPGAFELVPGMFHTLTPCRLVDTRETANSPALASGVTRLFQVVGPCSVGPLAQTVAVNATITGATAAGHLTIFPGGAAVPATSTLNFGVGQTRANNAVLPLALDASGTLAARAFVTAGGSVHFILDVNGWFE
jgi:hypothetical protein